LGLIIDRLVKNCYQTELCVLIGFNQTVSTGTVIIYFSILNRTLRIDCEPSLILLVKTMCIRK